MDGLVGMVGLGIILGGGIKVSINKESNFSKRFEFTQIQKKN